MRQPAVSELVKRAEGAGLVSRAHSEIDRRVVLVNLTREGEKRLRRGFDALRGDRATLAEALGLLMTKLEVMTKLEAQPLGRR